VWCANGNNVQPSAEIARRTVWIRLDSNRERPWERTDFRHPDLLGWAKAHRGELVTAALILIQAWVQAGMPAGPYVKGSYDRWAQVMGGILDTASIPGFLANERELFDTAVDSHASWRFFVEAWHAAYGTRAVTVGDLFNLVSRPDDAKAAGGTYRGLLDGVLGDGSEHSRHTRLGLALAEQRDRTVGTFKIVREGVIRGERHWRLVDLQVGLVPPVEEQQTGEVTPPGPHGVEGVDVVNVATSTAHGEGEQ
jgi:hypothetical protein